MKRLEVILPAGVQIVYDSRLTRRYREVERPKPGLLNTWNDAE
ncbi:hypothetical protein LPU83_0621 [Rhizobium favelukesii]|uniref:Uncharacterized protein n=1 Tax=Rhizobium favelukesii TaxID=348824 RepID=W6RC82_9HYPH|nr:hypothetical protein LPU83_0621 [Rhizobium favelukesii]